VMDKSLEVKLEEFRKTVTTSGEGIVFHKFPNKILDLHRLIQTSLDPDSPFHFSHAEKFTDTTIYLPPSDLPSEGPQLKKRKREVNGMDASNPQQPPPSVTNDTLFARFPGQMLANKHMSQHIHHAVKKESEQLAAMIDDVKLWVTLTMPKIEDGDNFGVQIQEEVLSELHRAQESAYNLRDATRQDHLARAKICSKILKYPNVEDYTIALKEHDEKQFYLARQHLTDIRNMYAVLTDLIHKNISKIRAPKANNSVGLY